MKIKNEITELERQSKEIESARDEIINLMNDLEV